jgi:hypothetical protein
MEKATAKRLSVKHPEHSLHQRMIDHLGISPAQADAALELVLDWAQTNYTDSRPTGQIVRTAVAADEPAGKPLKHCQTTDINLTVDHRNDAELLQHHGTVALRRVKVLRLSWEAYEQGALLSYEDLAAILVVDRATIKRLVASLREQGMFVPTRGVMKDMGRAPSHKESIGRLLCRGYVYTEVTAITGHNERSIERYALDLGRVIALMDQGAAPNEIRIICDLSEYSLSIYLALYEEHNTKEFRPHLDKLKRRFESGKGMVGPGQYPASKQVTHPIDRLRENDFSKATSRLLQQDLTLTETVGDLMGEKIATLNQQVFSDTDRLEPGQTIMLVESSDSAPKIAGQPTAGRPLVPVVLSPWTADKLQIWSSDHSTKHKRALIADALARQARAQGGTMTVTCLAVLLGTCPSAMASELAHLRQQQTDPTPIKGITEDAGATLTHKEIICDLQDQGYTPPEISIISLHAPESRDRYLKTNLRVETLIKVLETIPDEVQSSRFLGIQRSVVKQYLNRLKRKRLTELSDMEPASPCRNEPIL